MRFNMRVLGLCVVCVSLWGCGGEEAPVEQTPTCVEGEVVNPVTGMCMMTGADMSQTVDMSKAFDMSTMPDMMVDATMNSPDMISPSDMAADMAVVDMAADMAADMSDGEFGVLVGKITRTVQPKNGGVGPVFVALFEKNPITSSTSGADPGLVAFQRIENVNFTDPATAVPFRLEAIPPRPEPYFIIAFLDDNMSADTAMPETAGPDRDDLVSLNGIGTPKVTINAPGESMLDLVLNIAMIF